MNYKDITIEEAEQIINTLQCEMVCDADKKQIIFKNILEEFINNFRDGLLNAFNKVLEAAKAITEIIVQTFNSIKECVVKLFNKKIIKKRFIKLLQSRGLQRNDINKIIENNKTSYTMWRYLQSIPPNILTIEAEKILTPTAYL